MEEVVEKKEHKGSENLIPVNERPREEFIELSRKGGLASAQKKRESRALKDLIEKCFGMTVEQMSKDPDIQAEFIKIYGKDMSSDMAIVQAQFVKALGGDSKAFEILRDTCGQKVAEKVELKAMGDDIAEKMESLVKNEVEQGLSTEKAVENDPGASGKTTV